MPRHLIPCAVFLAFGACVGRADVNLDTTGSTDWNGTDAFGQLGDATGALATFGQTVTVPAGATRLSGFSLELNPNLADFSRLKLYVFNWDDSNHWATGTSLYTSGLIDSLPNGFQSVGAANLTLDLLAGSQVVLVLSAEELADSTEDAAEAGFAISGQADAYSLGAAFLLGSGGGDLTHLTDTPWIELGGNNHSDFAFTANFTVSPDPVPEAGTAAAAAALATGLLVWGIGRGWKRSD